MDKINSDRITIQCAISGEDTRLQLDQKAMPGEPGPCFMISASGCFKGYIARRKNGSYEFLGTPYYSGEDLQRITEQLAGVAQLTKAQPPGKNV